MAARASPAHEIMLVSPAVRNCIHESKLPQIHGLMAAQRELGGQTMDQSLHDLVKRDLVASADARAFALHKDTFAR